MREVPFRSSEAAPDVRVDVLEGFTQAIEAAAAAADPRHAFLRRQWFQATGAEAPTTLVASRADGRVIAALPTSAVGPRFAGLRGVPGSYWPYRSFPIAADASEQELSAMLASGVARKALGRGWRLGPVYDDDATATRLVPAAMRSGWTVLRRNIATSYLLNIAAVQAGGTWPRASTLKKNRWFEKQLAQFGELEWRFVSGTGWNPEVFDTLAAIEKASWVASDTDGSDAKFLAPHNRRFWEGAAQDPQIAAMMSAAILVIGGRPAAFSFDLDIGGVKHAIANSYDQAFAKHSPGKVLYYRNLMRAMESGTRLVDWGAGDNGYKRTIGAEAGPRIVDLLFVRNRALAAFLRPLWSRSGNR